MSIFDAGNGYAKEYSLDSANFQRRNPPDNAPSSLLQVIWKKRGIPPFVFRFNSITCSSCGNPGDRDVIGIHKIDYEVINHRRHVFQIREFASSCFIDALASRHGLGIDPHWSTCLHLLNFKACCSEVRISRLQPRLFKWWIPLFTSATNNMNNHVQNVNIIEIEYNICDYAPLSSVYFPITMCPLNVYSTAYSIPCARVWATHYPTNMIWAISVSPATRAEIVYIFCNSWPVQ